MPTRSRTSPGRWWTSRTARGCSPARRTSPPVPANRPPPRSPPSTPPAPPRSPRCSTAAGRATVAISTVYQNTQDILAVGPQNGITASWDASGGVLTLSGSASVANYQTALRSVTYVNTSDAPVSATRTVSFVVNDGLTNSNTA